MGERELAELAARQDGLVARHQARDHLSRKQLESRLATGRLPSTKAAMAAILEARRQRSHPGDSAGELELAMWLTAAGLPAPTLQHQVAAGGTYRRLAATKTPSQGQLRQLGRGG